MNDRVLLRLNQALNDYSSSNNCVKNKLINLLSAKPTK